MADPAFLLARRIARRQAQRRRQTDQRLEGVEDLERVLPRFGHGTAVIPAGLATGVSQLPVMFRRPMPSDTYGVIASVNGPAAANGNLTAAVLNRAIEGVTVVIRNAGGTTANPAVISVLAFDNRRENEQAAVET